MSNNSDYKTLVNHLEMKALADACVTSGNRSRFVIIIIIFASILAFMGYWNSRPNSYIHGRMSTARYAYKHKVYELGKIDSLSNERLSQIWAMNDIRLFTTNLLDIDTMPSAWTLDKKDSLYNYGLSQAKIKYNTVSNAKLQLSQISTDTLIESKRIDSLSTELARDSLSKYFTTEKDSLDKALALCKHRMFNKADRLHEFITYLERLHTERVLTFQVPVFGILLDVNDLGFFAGLTFIVVLLWLRFCLQKEYTNLKLVFENAKDDKREFAQWYNYLAMHQVLTVPLTIAYPQDGSVPPDRAIARFPSLVMKKLLVGPQISFKEMRGKPYRKLWSLIRILFFCLPFIVQASVIQNDFKTLGVGRIAASKLFVDRMFWIGVALLLAIGIMTILCLVLTWDIDEEWADRFKELNSKEQDSKDKNKTDN